MSETEAHTCHCGRRLSDAAYACRECVRTATTNLTRNTDLLDHIDDKRAKRGSRLWIGAPRPSADTPLPYDTRVRDVIVPITNELGTWARLHTEEHPDHEQLPTTLHETAVWLSRYTEWAATRPWALEAFDAYERMDQALTRLFDNPPETVALGECGSDQGEWTCTQILAAEVGAALHKCPRCGHQHDVQERRGELLEQADDFTVTVKEAVNLLRVNGHKADGRLVRAIIRHVGIISSGNRVALDTQGRVQRPVPVYRLGAIREGLKMMDSEDDRRAIKREMRGAPSGDVA